MPRDFDNAESWSFLASEFESFWLSFPMLILASRRFPLGVVEIESLDHDSGEDLITDPLWESLESTANAGDSLKRVEARQQSRLADFLNLSGAIV